MKHRSLTTIAAAAVVAVTLLIPGFGSPLAAAAPRPSATITLVCSRNVTYAAPGNDAPGINVFFYNSSGQIQDSSGYIYCPNGGGRYRYKAGLTQQWPQITVACFDKIGTPPDYLDGVELGETNYLPLPASGTCDSGSWGTGFASWTVR